MTTIRPAKDMSGPLSAWRARLKITQAEAAARLSIPVATYKRWEDGGGCEYPALVANAIGLPLKAIQPGIVTGRR